MARIKSHNRPATAALQARLAARELLALAQLLQEQAADLIVRAEQESNRDDWALAGTAMNLAHDAKKLVVRKFLVADRSEAEAEQVVNDAVAHKMAKDFL